MILWYEDDDIKIEFSSKPHVEVLYIKPDETFLNRKKITKKPFILNDDLKVNLKDYKKGKSYSFMIPKNYVWDGASIPRCFWRIMGANSDNRYLIPSLIHDYLCENHKVIDNDRYFSTIVFERLLYVSKVNSFSRWIMKHSVDNYQKFCNWRRK